MERYEKVVISTYKTCDADVEQDITTDKSHIMLCHMR